MVRSSDSSESQPAITSGAVAAGIATLFAYGCAVGTIYLKSYWGAFGIDPFQFSAPSDLAIVGLATIGATLCFAFLAALVGDAVGQLVLNIFHKAPWAPYVVGALILVFLIYVAFWIANGWLLSIGVVATWTMIYLWNKASFIPWLVKRRSFLPLLFLALIYLPFAVTYWALRDARKVLSKNEGWLLDSGNNSAIRNTAGPAKLAGRIGDTYVLYYVNSGTVVLLSTATAQQLALTKIRKPIQH